jgi:glucose-fructose oxidoreductase
MKRLLWSRRSFLKTSTGALLTVPTIIPSSVFGNAQAAPPSERVTLGHIGVGGRGTAVQQEFQKLPAAQCVAVCDPFRSKREERAAAIDQHYAEERAQGSYKGCATYNDFRDLLAREDIDAVVIATPDHWHVPIALEAVRAGKDVYVEKPLGLSFEQDRILREVVNRYGAVFQYGTQQRSDRDFRYACELVRNGRIGKLHTMHVWCTLGGAGGSTQTEPVPEGFDYDMWLGPAPSVPYTADRCRPCGTFWIMPYSIGYIAGWGVHPLDIAQWGHGSDNSAPVEYEGTGTIPSDGLYDVIESWDTTLRYADGVEVRYVSSDRVRPLIESYRRPNDHGTTFIGDKGWVSVDRGGLYADPPSLLNSEIGLNEIHLYESGNHWQNFVDCIKSRKETISPIDTAVRVDTLSHLCDIAIRLGRKIRWDPVTERISGDSDAERMLTRPMRAPWTL